LSSSHAGGRREDRDRADSLKLHVREFRRQDLAQSGLRVIEIAEVACD
jgi:hypothetical protein